MPIAKITGPGLAAMACSVALLWGCLIADGVLERRVSAQRAEVLRELHRLRDTRPEPAPEPVSVPLPTMRVAPSFAG